jgi:nitroreductase
MIPSATTNNAGIDTSNRDGDVEQQPYAEILDKLLSERHSCRAFSSRQVPRETMEKFLSIAQRTASWCNSQPWHVKITSGAATDRFRAALVSHVTQAGTRPAPDIPFPREYRGVYLDRRRECGFQLYDSVGIKRGDREASGRQSLENFRLFGAPHVAIITTEEPLGTYGAVDCGAYIGNFLLAAQCFGIASIAQAALASHSKFVRGHFGIPDDRLMVCAISFGYEDASHPANAFRTRRAALTEAVDWVGD